MAFSLLRPTSRALDMPGRLILGFGLGSVAAAAAAAAAVMGAVTFYRARLRVRGDMAASPGSASSRTTAALESPSKDWIAGGRSMDTLVPAAYSVPDPDLALDTYAALDPAADSLPVGSVFSDPGPTAGSPADPDPVSQASISSLSPVSEPEPEGEAWMDALRRAMASKPSLFGYGQSAWTAPLLGRYLRETQGVAVPVPRLRSALKDLGYRWDRTRYVYAGPGNGPQP